MSALDPKTIAQAFESDLARRNLLEFAQRMDPSFERARHLELLAGHLEAIERREIRRLIVAMPPRHGKSRTTSQLFPAWFLGRNPRQHCVLASYGAELAEENSRRVRDLVSDARYPFDVQLSEDSRAVNRWATSAGGGLIAAGVGSSLTGFGADLLVVDDPVRDREAAESQTIRDGTWAWYQDVARPRLHPGGAQILISTRWHEDDLVGRALNSAGASDWTLLVLPAICEDDGDVLGREAGAPLWPERFPVAELPSVERGEISSRSFAALYQQRPAPAEGNLFKRDWFGPRNRFSQLPETRTIIASIDTASKTGVHNDWSVIAVLAYDKVNFYVVDVMRERLEFAQLAERVVRMHRQYKPSRIYIEDASAGIAIVQELKRLTSLPVIPVPAKGSKISRWEAVTARFESGKVLFPERAPWLEYAIDEFCSVPAARHDDVVDAVVLGLSQKARYVYDPDPDLTIEDLQGIAWSQSGRATSGSTADRVASLLRCGS